jgi:predicted ArsR family transcriptional regulator
VELDLEGQLASIAALADPVRTALYRYVVAQGSEVSRNEAAEGVGITRSLATFHLEKLVKQRLLETSYRRLSDRRGPGAGRTSKLYRRSNRQLQVSLPPRDYELAARALAQALAADGRTTATKKLRRIAREIGAGWAAESPASPPLESLEATLNAHGYEPYWDRPNKVRLRNCPFEALVPEHQDVVCKVLNLALMEGLIDGLGAQRVSAVYAAPPPVCCVSLRVGPERDNER